jgi:hypothetical protein
VSNAGKREQKIRRNTKNVSLEDFEWLIRRYGSLEFGGNHAIANIGGMRFPYKRKNPVLFHYVQELLKILDNRKEG